MKALVNSLSTAVRRWPWWVIGVIVVLSMVLGNLSGQFQPEEDSNESFAPDAPELDAVDRISELFGDESSTAVMQVIVSADGGDVFTMDGYAATQAINETVRSGSFADILIDESQQPAVLSWLAPVEQAVAVGGQPAPQSDAELQQLYLGALAELPEEQAGFAAGLLPAGGDATVPTADKALMLVFTTGAESIDEFDAFVTLSGLAADEILETELPSGFTAEPFSFELLFEDEDEFQNEVLRLLGTAALIIALVLAAVFLVVPRSRKNKLLAYVGFAAVAVAITLSVLPTLAKSFPDLLPDAVADWNAGAIFGVAAFVLLAVLLIWSATSIPLRRTAADTALTLITIFFAISWMNGFGFIIFGDANPMAQILPILLIGLGVDYSIHVTSRYREQMAGGDTVDDSVSTAIRTVGVALVLATLTTAVGFLTNVVNEIPALREFGLLAAIGIVASFLLMLTFVPAVRELLDRRGIRRETLDRERLRGGDSRALPRVIGSTSVLAKKVPALVLVVALGLGAVGVFGTLNLESKFSFIDFIPTTSPLRNTFESLLEEFGGGFGENTQIIVEGDVSSAEGWNGMVAANQNLTGVENVVTFAGFPAGTSPVSVIGQMAQQDSPTFVPAVGQALQEAGVDPQTFQVPAGASLAPVFDAAFEAAPREMAVVIHPSDTGGYDAALFDITTQAGEAGAGQLRLDVTEAFSPVTSAGLTAVATSDEIINDVIVATLRDSQLQSLVITLAAALVLLFINFWFEARRPMLGVITTIPVVLVVLLSFAIMAWVGIPFGPITATISALAIGIGIPYMIHITHRYLEDRERCATADEAVESTLTHTGGALAGSALTTVAGFGILVTSTTIPFRQFGFVTAYTILLAMLAAVLILPSMLVFWDGFHRRRGEKPAELDPMLLEGTRPEGVPGS